MQHAQPTMICRAALTARQAAEAEAAAHIRGLADTFR